MNLRVAVMKPDIWGLSQGLLGRARTLTPSLRAVGPNTYLTQRDFLKMMAAALLVHALIFGIAALVPHEKVTNIPVRALSFKLGDEDNIAAYAPAAGTPAPAPTAAPVLTASRETWQATPDKPAPEIPAPLKPVEKVKPEPKPQPKPKAAPKPIAERETPVEQPAPQPPMSTPQQYIREVGGPSQQAVAAAMQSGTPTGAIGGSGNELTMTQQTAQAARARYTQEVSAWIERHKLYPAEAKGSEGRSVVRVRIDRMGNVRYYAIEQSSGSQALDQAALDMIRRANPMPAAPQNYPEGNLIEFLIPISFKAPL